MPAEESSSYFRLGRILTRPQIQLCGAVTSRDYPGVAETVAQSNISEEASLTLRATFSPNWPDMLYAHRMAPYGLGRRQRTPHLAIFPFPSNPGPPYHLHKNFVSKMDFHQITKYSAIAVGQPASYTRASASIPLASRDAFFESLSPSVNPVVDTSTS